MPDPQGPISSGPNDLWAWLQQYGGNWLSAPYGGHSTNYGPPPGGPGSAGNSSGYNNPFQAAASAPATPPIGVVAANVSGDSVNPPGGDDHGTGPPDVRSQADIVAAQPQPQPRPGMPAIPIGGGPGMAMQAPTPTFAWPDSSTPTGMPAPPPQGSPSATPRPAGPLAASGGGGATMKRTPGAPNLGYYQGNNRFVQVNRPNASAAGGFGRGGPPQMTALNLAGLFGGRGQPAAAPAVNPNVPAANAQPVSALAPGQNGGMVPDAYPGDNWDIDAQGNVVPSFGDPRRKQGFKSSSSSQGGGY